jgi:hypothetical protein
MSDRVTRLAGDVQDRVRLVRVLLQLRDGLRRRQDQQLDPATLGLAFHLVHDVIGSTPRAAATWHWESCNSSRRRLICSPRHSGATATCFGFSVLRTSRAHGKMATRQCVSSNARNRNLAWCYPREDRYASDQSSHPIDRRSYPFCVASAGWGESGRSTPGTNTRPIVAVGEAF